MNSNLSNPLYNPTHKIGHEFRGTLQIIVARLQLLQQTTDEKLTKENVDHLLAICQASGERFTELMDEALPMKTPPLRCLVASEPLRCLVAEDQPDTQKFIVNTLQKQGHTVVSAVFTAKEMVEAALQFKPAVIIFDINLAPDTGQEHSNGLDALTEIVKVLPNVMGVAITGSEDFNLVMRASENGGVVFNYLLKPVGNLQLIAALNVAYSRWFQFQELKAEASDTAAQLADARSVMKAKHIIMKRYDWSEDRAYKYLQRTAKSNQMKMRDLATLIIGGKENEVINEQI